MATRLEAARLLTRNAAERKQAGLRCDVEAGMAKLFASETALELSMEAMRIHGGVGYTTDFPVERYYRDRSEEHTSELQSLMRISYAVFCLKKKKIECSHNKQHYTL